MDRVLVGHIPSGVQSLPRDERGYPVPWFVVWEGGKPHFPVMDGKKWYSAVEERRCWVCGGRLGSHLAFVSGPMCGITRTSAEPPSHRDCAEFSLRNCPFLINPDMKRVPELHHAEIGARDAPGIMLKTNPGVSLLWLTKKYSVARVPGGGHIIKMGEPTDVQCWTRGRLATAEETIEAVTRGYPNLLKLANAEGEEAKLELARMKSIFLALVGLEDK